MNQKKILIDGNVWEGWNKTLFVIVMWYYPVTYSGID